MTFTASADPDSISSIKTPFSSIAWSWQPDSGTASSVCSSRTTCTPPAGVSGTLTATAMTNGLVKTKTARVAVSNVQPQLELSPSETAITAGEEITFTGLISPDSIDGVAVPVTNVRWAFQPDGIVVAALRSTEVASRQHRPALSAMTADPSTVTVADGDTIRAYTETSDVAPDDRPVTEACTHGALQCTIPVYSSGTVILTATIRGQEQFKTAYVRVEYFCPKYFQRNDYSIYTERSHLLRQPDVPLGPRVITVSGFFEYISKVGQNGDFPVAHYHPPRGRDTETGFGVLTLFSWTKWECHRYMWKNKTTGEWTERGEMHFLRESNLILGPVVDDY